MASDLRPVRYIILMYSIRVNPHFARLSAHLPRSPPGHLTALSAEHRLPEARRDPSFGRFPSVVHSIDRSLSCRICLCDRFPRRSRAGPVRLLPAGRVRSLPANRLRLDARGSATEQFSSRRSGVCSVPFPAENRSCGFGQPVSARCWLTMSSSRFQSSFAGYGDESALRRGGSISAQYNRRRIQFRLSKLFVLVLLTGVTLTGWNSISPYHKAQREQDAFIAAIEALGGSVRSDTFGPSWFPVRTVYSVSFNGRPLRDKDLAYLSKFPAPKPPFSCDLSASLVTDAGLPHLAKWTTMESLTLDGCQITDRGIRELRERKRAD